MAKTTIVIPNWNGKAYLEDCLSSVFQQEGGAPEVILVDNGSEDESVSYVKEHYPAVKLIEFSQNTGFCKAVNAGIKAAGTEYVLLLNNDTKADRCFLRRMEERIGQSEKIFSASGKMLSMKEPEYVDDAGDYYCALGKRKTGFAGLFPCEKDFCRLRGRSNIQKKGF